MNWIHDLVLESQLARLGISWQFVSDVKLYQIDVRQSQRNQKRHNQPTLSDEHWQRIAAYFAENPTAAAPAIILHTISGQKRPAYQYIVLDGNHRLAAAQHLRQKTIAAYVLSGLSDAMIELLIRSQDTPRYLPQDEASVSANVLYLVTEYQFNDKQIAAEMGLSVSKVSQIRRNETVRNRLRQLKIEPFGLGEGVLDRLSAVQNDEVLAKLAQLALDAKLPTDIVSHLVTEINRLHNDSDQLALLRGKEHQYGDIRLRKRQAVLASVSSASPRPTDPLSRAISQISRATQRLQSNGGRIAQYAPADSIADLVAVTSTLNQVVKELVSGNKLTQPLARNLDTFTDAAS